MLNLARQRKQFCDPVKSVNNYWKNRFQKAAKQFGAFLNRWVYNSTACLINFAQHLTKNAGFFVVNMSVSEDESLLLAREGTEFDECQTSNARKDSHEEILVVLVKTVESSIEGEFSKLHGDKPLRRFCKSAENAHRQDKDFPRKRSDSDPEEKQPPRKRSKKQELSDDDVIKVVNELISTSNKQTTDLPVNNLSQSTILASLRINFFVQGWQKQN